MKNLLLATLIVLAAQMNVKAATGLLDYKITGNRSFELNVKNVVGQARLKLEDLEERTLYNVEVDHDGSYSKTFNVSQLPKGTYYLSIEDEFKTQTVNVYVGTEVTLDFAGSSTKLNPIISGIEDKVVVSLYALENERMNIAIYDKSGNQIESTRLKGAGYIGRKFCLEALEAGSYYVVVNHRGRTFRKEITI